MRCENVQTSVMRYRLLPAVALALLPTTAFAADQFDLICTAPKEAQRFRIDLARGEWCFKKCELVQKLAGVTSGMISLHDHVAEYRGDSTYYNRINRLTGEWEWYNHDPKDTALGLLPMDVRGRCEVAPFSGMPTPKF